MNQNFYQNYSDNDFQFQPQFGDKTVGEYEQITGYLTKKVKTPNPYPTLLFFDPWGYKGIDTLALGYQIGKITPYLLVGNVDTKQEIRYKGRTIKKDNETALIWGTALSYRFYNQTVSINLIAPSKPLNLRYAVGLGYNFYI